MSRVNPTASGSPGDTSVPRLSIPKNSPLLALVVEETLTQLRPTAVKLRILVLSFRSYFILEGCKPAAFREHHGTPENATGFIECVGEARRTRPRDDI